MTERKPDDVSWESWIERQIQDGQRNGAFDQLPGHGRPIDGIGIIHDDLWWAKAKLRDEDIEILPPTIAIRAERAEAIESAMRAVSDAQVRAIVDGVNARIRYVNSYATSGPPSTTVTIDVEELLVRWRAASPLDTAVTPDREPTAAAVVESSVDRWWQRAWRRRRRARHTLSASATDPAVRPERRTGGRRRHRDRAR